MYALAWLLATQTVVSGIAAQEVPFRRLSATPLMVPLPGVAVIQDSTRWERLWRRFERYSTIDGRLIRTRPPPVDFRSDMLIAVGLGGNSGCSNEASYIQRILETANTLIVEVGPADLDNSPCPAYIAPIDIVQLPRSPKRVLYRSLTSDLKVPKSAPWWQEWRWADIARMPSVSRELYYLILVRDPKTPAEDIIRIAKEWGPRDPEFAGFLIERADVQRHPDALTVLAGRTDSPGQKARQILLGRLALRLAGRRQTPAATLQFYIREVGRDPTHTQIAHLLVQNPRVRADSSLLSGLIHSTSGYPEVRQQACREFLNRWPAGDQMNGTTQWSSRLPCREPSRSLAE